LDGTSNTQDLLALNTALQNGTAGQPGNRARYDMNRDSNANTQDLLRLVQLLNGVSSTQIWNGAHICACPPPCMPPPLPLPCPEGGGGGGGDGGKGGGANGPMMAGGDGDNDSGQGDGPSAADIAQIITAVQAACAEAGIAPPECQQMIDNLFGSQP
jgi:hypothetical protein